MLARAGLPLLLWGSTGGQGRREPPCGYLVAQPASRGAGLGTEGSGERIAEALVLGEGLLGPRGLEGA